MVYELKQVIPSKFSRTYLNKFEGIASIRVGQDIAMKVNVAFTKKIRRSFMNTGWKSFNQKYNLQVGDICKFVMTQFHPLSFTITITQASKGSSPKKLQGFSLFFVCFFVLVIKNVFKLIFFINI